MARITVYVDDDMHRALKAAASLRGISLSDFMVQAAQRMLHTPDRKRASSKMDSIRRSISPTFSTQEMLEMRDKGRRH